MDLTFFLFLYAQDQQCGTVRNNAGTISQGAMLAYSGLLQMFMISRRISAGILLAGFE